MEPLTLSISALQKAYSSGSLSPTDLVEHLYRQLNKSPLPPVWICQVPKDQALVRASSLASSVVRGPLYGIPFAVKDNIDVAGLPTTAGCPAFSYVPSQTAFVVQRLLDAGAILIGKTNMDQFATGLVGTRSPYGVCASVFDPQYISGGSSSGSAVAVAAGLVSFALGTDTAGSGRVPAAFNNIFGLKPTRGLISTAGVVPACRSLDCVSIFALNAQDCQTVLRASAAFDEEDIFSRRAERQALTPISLRVGIPKPSQREFFGNQEYQRLYEQTLASFKAKGAEMVEFDLQPFLDTAQLLYGGPFVAERYAAVGKFIEQNQEVLDPTVGSIILDSKKYSAAEAYSASYRLAQLQRLSRQVWKAIDIIVLPTTPSTYTIQEVAVDPIRLNANLGYYTNFVNLLDLCALAVPAGFTSAGLPFGVSLIAPGFHEEMLLHTAASFMSQSIDSPSTQGWVALAVLGAHLRGQPLNHQLTQRGAIFSRAVKTSGDYKLYALSDTKPQKPGLIRVPGFEGPGIEAEIWMVPDDQFGSFVDAIPAPLGIGTCKLEDGATVKGFLCESCAVDGMHEITSLGGWRAYLKTQ